MSFLEMVESDIQNVFFNDKEFAVSATYFKHNICYDDSGNSPITIDAVFYPDSIVNNYGESVVGEIGDYTLYIKKNNLSITIEDDIGSNIVSVIDCEIGDYIKIDNKLYTIVTIREETMGSWTCGAMKRVTSAKTSNYSSYRR